MEGLNGIFRNKINSGKIHSRHENCLKNASKKRVGNHQINILACKSMESGDETRLECNQWHSKRGLSHLIKISSTHSARECRKDAFKIPHLFTLHSLFFVCVCVRLRNM
jgi:hypothetical protein